MRIIFTKYHKLREIEQNCSDDSTSFYNLVSSFSSAKKEKITIKNYKWNLFGNPAIYTLRKLFFLFLTLYKGTKHSEKMALCYVRSIPGAIQPAQSWWHCLLQRKHITFLNELRNWRAKDISDENTEGMPHWILQVTYSMRETEQNLKFPL